jgi:hypothetical protein
MNLYTSTLILIFGVLFYMMTVDKNVSDAILLTSKLASNSVKGFFWKLYFHPQNPITNFIMKMKYDRIAMDLHKELTEKAKSSIVDSETKNS